MYLSTLSLGGGGGGIAHSFPWTVLQTLRSQSLFMSLFLEVVLTLTPSVAYTDSLCGLH